MSGATPFDAANALGHGGAIERLPVIDLRHFDFDDAGARQIAGEIDRAFTEIGFCYIADTGMPPDLIERLFAASAAFHAQPQAAKEALAINAFHRGYMAPKTSLIVTSSVAKVTRPNNSESFMMMHEVSKDDPAWGKPLQGPNQWPAGLPGFRQTVTAYNAALDGLARRLTRLVAGALGMPSTGLDCYFEKPTTFLRLLHYPPQARDAAEEEFGSAPHTDYGFITILLQDAVGGLEVRQRDGGWLAATPIPKTFVVNVGDILARWTNGRWQSTPHRVKNRSNVERYSAPFFYDPAMTTTMMTTTIKCLPACLKHGEAARYEPIIYGDYLMERLDKNYQYRHSAG